MLQRINKWASRASVLIKTSPFLRHNAIFMTGSLGVSALNYLFYPILGRLMSPADFGEVQTLMSLFTQAAIFLTILSYVTIHVTVNTPDEKERNQTLLGLERVAMIIGYSLLAIALLSVNQLRVFLNFTDNWPFIALIVALAISIPLVFRMAYLRGKQQFFRASLVDGVGSVVKLVLATILVLLGFQSFGTISAVAISQIISLIVGLVWAHQAGFHGFAFGTTRIRFDLLKPYLKHAFAVLLGVGGVTLVQTLGVLTAKHYFPPTEAGLYAGITTIAGIVYFLTAPVTAVLITLISTRISVRKNQARLKASLALVILLGGGALLSMSLFPETIINILIGPKYLVAANFLPNVGLAMLFLAIANMLMMYHIALKRYKYSLVSIPVCAIMLVIMQLNHGKMEDVINNIILVSLILLIITALQNFFFYHHQPREDNA